MEVVVGLSSRKGIELKLVEKQAERLKQWMKQAHVLSALTDDESVRRRTSVALVLGSCWTEGCTKRHWLRTHRHACGRGMELLTDCADYSVWKQNSVPCIRC